MIKKLGEFTEKQVYDICQQYHYECFSCCPFFCNEDLDNPCYFALYSRTKELFEYLRDKEIEVKDD